MKKYLLLLGLLPFSLFSKVLDIENRKIEIPIPEKFIEVTKDMGELSEFFYHLNKSILAGTNGKLTPLNHYLYTEDILNEKNNMRNCYIASPSINKRIKNNTDTYLVFNVLKKEFIKLDDRKLNDITKQVNSRLDNINKALSPTGIEYNSVAFTGDNRIIEDKSNLFIIINNSPLEAKLTDVEIKDNTLTAIAIANINERLLVSYCYSSPNEFEWLSNTIKDWQQAILKAN